MRGTRRIMYLENNHWPFISAFVHGPRAVSRWSSEQGERKSGCPSEASYLIFRPASVAKACEEHEALTFWLLLGQAKSDKKEILRFALNDKLIVNCQLLIVMRGTRRIMYLENNH